MDPVRAVVHLVPQLVDRLVELEDAQDGAEGLRVLGDDPRAGGGGGVGAEEDLLGDVRSRVGADSPGSIAVTVTPVPRNSSASDSLSDST